MLNPRQFEKVVREAVESIPTEFRDALENIDIVIDEHPTPELLEELGMDPEELLFGLYQGIPLPERELGSGGLPDKITLYRGDLLCLDLSREELIEEIRITVIHEIGHYFGLDDDHMEELGY